MKKKLYPSLIAVFLTVFVLNLAQAQQYRQSTQGASLAPGVLPDDFIGPAMPPEMVRSRLEGGSGVGPSFVRLSEGPISVNEARLRIRRFSESVTMQGLCANSLSGVLPASSLDDLLSSEVGELYSLCSLDSAFDNHNERDRLIYAPDNFCQCVNQKVQTSARVGGGAYREIPYEERSVQTEAIRDSIISAAVRLLSETEAQLADEVAYAFESPEFAYMAYDGMYSSEEQPTTPSALQYCLAHNIRSFSEALTRPSEDGQNPAYCSSQSMDRINSMMDERPERGGDRQGGGSPGSLSGCSGAGDFCNTEFVTNHFQRIIASRGENPSEAPTPRATKLMIDRRAEYFNEILVYMMNHLHLNDGEWGTSFSMTENELERVRLHILMNPSLRRRFEQRSPDFMERLRRPGLTWTELQHSEYGRYLQEDLLPDAVRILRASDRSTFNGNDIAEAMGIDLSNDLTDLARRCLQVQRTRASLCRALDESQAPPSLSPFMTDSLLNPFIERFSASAQMERDPNRLERNYRFIADSSFLLCREHEDRRIRSLFDQSSGPAYAQNETSGVDRILEPIESYLRQLERRIDAPADTVVTPTSGDERHQRRDLADISSPVFDNVHGTEQERREFRQRNLEADRIFRRNEQRLIANQNGYDPAGNRQLNTGGIDSVTEGGFSGGSSSTISGGPAGTPSEGLFGRDSADFARQQYPGVSGAAGSGGPNLPPDREALAAREELEEREMTPEERRLQERLEELERRERALMARLEELEQERQRESSEELIAQYQAQIEQLNREVAANRTRLEEQRAELAERSRVARETRIQTPPETPAPFSGFGGGTRAARVSEPAAAPAPSATTPVAGRNGGGSGVIRRSGGGSETPIAPSSVVTGSGAGGSTAPVLSLSSSAILPTGTNLVQLAQEAVGAVAYRRTAQTGMVERVVFETANGEIVYKDGQPEIAYIELVSEAQIALEGSTTPGRAPASLLDRNETPEELDERDPTRYRGLLRVMDESLGD